jgi:HD-GYP domain-containing protein (c-di-GMP phosphodiesterase class II)
MLARGAGYTKDEAEQNACAALLHDIGKCHVSEELLDKPGALSPDERAQVALHTGYGCERIEQAMRVLQSAYYIAKYHHECWDGSGYYGLRAQRIHPHARIATVADVFDALASDRAYKSAWEPHKVIGYIRDHAGMLFDPIVVAALLDSADDVLSMYHK